MSDESLFVPAMAAPERAKKMEGMKNRSKGLYILRLPLRLFLMVSTDSNYEKKMEQNYLKMGMI